MKYNLTLDSLEPIEEDNKVTLKDLAELEERLMQVFRGMKQEIDDLKR